MKKLLVLVISLLMVFGLFACGEKPVDNPDDDNPTDETIVVPDINLAYDYLETEGIEDEYMKESAEIYNAVFGQFANTYKLASSASSVSEKYALQAIAEAKLLETGAILPGEGQGGNYAVSRVAPGTVPSVYWGLDTNRIKHLLAVSGADIAITAEQRTELKNDWINAASASAYRASAKSKLEGWGYTIKDTYSMQYTADPYTFDVIDDYHSATSEPLSYTFDFLLEYDAKNVLQPALAKSIPEISGNTVTFEIRDDAKWVTYDGSREYKVTGDDFVAGFQHMLDCGYFGELVEGLIAGVAEYDGTNFDVVGVKANGQNVTYTFEEGADTSYFFTMLSYTTFAPLNREYFVSMGGGFGDGYDPEAETYTYGKDYTSILYNGAYIIKSYSAENTIEFTKNEKYYDAANVDIKAVTWLFNDGSDSLFGYNLFKAGTIDAVGLNTAALELAKKVPAYNNGIYTTSVDGNTYPFWFNGNRSAYESMVGTTYEMTSNKNDAQKATAKAAFANQYFRNALSFAIDRVTYEAASVSPELAPLSLLNSYTPGELVYLDEEVTVKINGVDTKFAAGTYYGEIMQAQLDADKFPITVWVSATDADQIAKFEKANGNVKINFENARGTNHGFDGWYNPANAKAFLAKAIEQLAKDGITISKSNPVFIEIPYVKTSTVSLLSNNAIVQSINNAFDGLVVASLIAVNNNYSLYYAAYFNDFGNELNVDISKISGWGPDYGDPKTYLDTFLNGQGGMVKNFGIY